MEILKNFKSLQILIIRSFYKDDYYIKFLKRELTKLIEQSDMKEIRKNYQMKQFSGWILFSKERSDDSEISQGILSSILRKLLFFNRKK